MNQKLRTVSQFADENPAFTESALRWHIFNEKKNGLSERRVILRIGRRIYIDVDRFFEWVSSQCVDL